MAEKEMSLLTHPPPESWTAVYSNAGCFRSSEGKTMKRFVHFWKQFQFWQQEVGQCKPSSYLFKSKTGRGRGWVGVSVSQNQQWDCVTETIVTLWKQWDVRCFLKRFTQFYGLFLDGWWLLRVIWSESDTARVRSSPPGYNKTWERRPTMERSWWRTFASNWPPPSRLGPPVRRGPSPRVTPRSISASQSGE